MATAYVDVSVSDYNATPPTDDGSSGSTNTITWAKIKTKLGDPLNTAIAAINTNFAATSDSCDSAHTSANSTITTLNSTMSGYTGGNSLNAPSTTAMLFGTSAPTGWTRSTTHDNKALRLVSGTVSTGGSTSFTSVFTSRTLTSAHIPAHTHTWSASGSISLNRSSFLTSISAGGSSGNWTSGGNTSYSSISTSSGSASSSISFSGTSSTYGSSTALDFAIKYFDVIICTKD
ncbi:MAG TPA: hypothetical protein VIY48_07100 [Candidatus Paceibacterota bacterium]